MRVVVSMPVVIPVALCMLMCVLVHSFVFYVIPHPLEPRRFACCWKYGNTLP